MALTSILFGGNTRAVIGEDSVSGAFELDASIQEDHILASTVTRSPIEKGSTIGDHVVPDPIRLTMRGIVSKTPISLLGTVVTSAATALAPAVGEKHGAAIGGAALVAGASIGGLLASSREPGDVYQHLMRLWFRREPLIIITGLRSYTDMILTNVSVPRNARIGGALEFTASLEKVEIVSTGIIEIPESIMDAAVSASGANTQDTGKGATPEASDSTASTSRSTLDTLLF